MFRPTEKSFLPKDKELWSPTSDGYSSHAAPETEYNTRSMDRTMSSADDKAHGHVVELQRPDAVALHMPVSRYGSNLEGASYT